MIKILAIANSFSQDATRFLSQILDERGIENKVVNLYIGGCPLERHWANIETGEQAYEYELAGSFTGRMISIDEALREEEWDHIITQQASGFSGWKESYEPFLGLMIDHIRKICPKAKLWLQQTWAYEVGAPHANFMRYYRDQQLMYAKLSACYREMGAKYGLDLIPCGDMIQLVRKTKEFDFANGGLSLCRDGYHMSHTYGRFLLGCCWANKLAGVDVSEIGFVPVHEGSPEADAALLKVIKDTLARNL